MTHVVKLAGRALPLLVLAMALGACDGADPTEPLGTTADPVTVLAAASPAPSLARTSFGGGIPFGVFHLPMTTYGAPFSASLTNTSTSTSSLLGYLEAARQSGMRVVVSFVGAHKYYRNEDESFNMEKWKKRVDAYRGINFSSYVADGTIIGHYILDEPHDASNWGGQKIPHATIDEMARYSKSIWPTMPTIIRGWPAYLKGYKYRYLDASWAQYSDRFGSVSTFISENVRDAKASGLALVVGLNQLAGGSKNGLQGFYPGKYSMRASDLESWGRVLVNEPYVCAFLSWRYDSNYMSRSDIKEALASLAQSARNRSTTSCRGTNGQTVATEPTPPVTEPTPPVTEPTPPVTEPTPPVTEPTPPVTEPTPPVTEPTPPVTEPTPPVTAPSSILLGVTGRADAAKQYMTLTWSGAQGASVDVYRNGVFLTIQANDGRYSNSRSLPGSSQYTYKVCQVGTTVCSNVATVQFGGAPPPPVTSSTPPVTTDPVPPVPADPDPVPPVTQPTEAPVSGGTPAAIVLQVTGRSEKGLHYMTLTWSGAKGTTVDVHRNSTKKKNTENDRRYVNVRTSKNAATYVYKVCEKNTSTCSKSVSISVK